MNIATASSRPMPAPITFNLTADERKTRFTALVNDYFKTIAEFNENRENSRNCLNRLKALQVQINNARQQYGGLDDLFKGIIADYGPMIFVKGQVFSKL